MAQGTTKGVPIDTDINLAANIDSIVPSEKAVKSYIDNKALSYVQGAASSTDGHVAVFSGTGGKTIKDTNTITNNLVIQPASGLALATKGTNNNAVQTWGSATTVFASMSADGGLNIQYINANSYSGLPYQGKAIYGTGYDAAVDLDVVGAGGIVYNSTTSEYEMTRDIYATIFYNGGYILNTKNYRIFCTESFQNFGTIHCNGSSAVGPVAGIGATAGFFKAGGTGATGLAAASAGANGTAPTAPTTNTMIGGFGGRGAPGHASVLTFEGLNCALANSAPTVGNGGPRKRNSIESYLSPWFPSSASINWQMTPSVGGGAGAKSIIGTTATSGGGGGGAGIVFIASPFIDNGIGIIQAIGGNGGDATGTGGNFGGGGGGGGGIIALVYNTISNGTESVYGGVGGVSISSATGLRQIGVTNGTITSTTATISLTPTLVINRESVYLLSVNIFGSAGNIPTIINIQGLGFTNAQLINFVEYNTTATPTKRLELWSLTTLYDPIITQLEEPILTITLSGIPINVRANLDEIQNIAGDGVIQTASDLVDSATTLTVTLPSVPASADAMTYAVFAMSAGTLPVAGAGMTLLNSQTTPYLISEVGLNKQNPIQTHTTASAVAGIAVEFSTRTEAENGTSGGAGFVTTFIN